MRDASRAARATCAALVSPVHLESTDLKGSGAMREMQRRDTAITPSTGAGKKHF
jgi:hypothetical protein